jgi:hypothetical protein
MLSAGDEFILEKTATQKGKRVITEIAFEAIRAERSNRSGNGNGAIQSNGDDLKQIMLECLQRCC